MRENGAGRGDSRLPILQSGLERISLFGEQETAFERYRFEKVSGSSGAMRNGEFDWQEQIQEEGEGMKETHLDWDIELAQEIGLITEATEEIQGKLDIMHEAYIGNYKFIQESMLDTFPRTVLESEAKQKLKNIKDSHQREIKALEQTIKNLEWDNRELRFRLRELREKYE